jgi:hypothetical protein
MAPYSRPVSASTALQDVEPRFEKMSVLPIKTDSVGHGRIATP